MPPKESRPAKGSSRIKTARAQHPDRAYADLLTEVLDYRRWREFGFTLIAVDGGEEGLTQARHSTLSGGEQSVSLHLPLFAAAHVLLSSARDSCPRLLALDEAFVGVDDNGRRELLGLTTQFDLDLFMTGVRPLGDLRHGARLRGPGERANAPLKTWRILRKLRCCPRCAGRLAKAIHVLQNYELTTG